MGADRTNLRGGHFIRSGEIFGAPWMAQLTSWINFIMLFAEALIQL